MRQLLLVIMMELASFASLSLGQTVDTIRGCDDIPPSSIAAISCTICDFDVHHGTNRTYTPSLEADWCGTIENDQYIGFVAGPIGSVVFYLEAYDCIIGSGLEAAIYDETNSLIGDCSSFIFPSSPNILEANDLIPGNFYYLRIDGYLDDRCSFLVQVITGLFSEGPSSPGPIVGPERVCWNETSPYFIAPIPNATSYYWRLTPGIWTQGAEINPSDATNPMIGTSNQGIDLELPPLPLSMPPGTCDNIRLEVFPLNPCFPSADSSVITIQVCRSIQDTTFAEVCPDGEYEFPDGSGDLYSSYFEFITVNLGPDANGCDSFGVLYIDQIIGVPSNVITNVVLCEGEIADLCGFPDSTIVMGPAYCFYEGAAISNCEDSIAYFNVLFLEPEAQVEITSSSQADTLHAISRIGNIPPSTKGDSVSYLWSNSAGEILGSSPFIVVNEPDVYTLEVSMFSYLDPSISCSSTTSVMSTTSGTDGLPATASLTLYPNPTTSELQWELRGIPSQQAIDVSISDVLGRVIWSKQYLEGEGFRQNLSTVDWTTGLYSITFCGDGFLDTHQVVKK